MGITQFEMCDRIVAIIRRDVNPNFSMAYPAYNKLETGDTVTPKHSVLKAIKEITGLSLDYLITGEEPEAEARFLTEEAEKVGAMIDKMSQTGRKFIEGVAIDLLALDKEQHQRQMRIARLLLDNINALDNGDRATARAYIADMAPAPIDLQ